MSLEWLALIGIAIVVVLLVVFRNTEFVKKNWKYFLILAPLIILIILKIVSAPKKKGDQVPSSGGNTPDGDLERNIGKLRDKLEEVQMETAIEISAAKTKNEEVIKQLEEVKNIEDKTERRKRLAAMIG